MDASKAYDPSKGYEKVNAKDDIDVQEYSERWEKTWAQGLEQGQQFDKAGSSPCLLDILSADSAQGIHVDVKGKRVVVPGCGRGYDVAAFVAAGALECVGLELAMTAVERGNAYLRDSGVNPKRGRVEVGDFLKPPNEPSPLDQFYAGFDYTFLCAMHPSMRKDWAEGWARRLAPGGLLIALAYPIDASRDTEVGPPFPLTPDIYQSLLVDTGLFVEERRMQAVPEILSHPARGGIEMIAIFKRL